jgi:hypothetical protein
MVGVVLTTIVAPMCLRILLQFIRVVIASQSWREIPLGFAKLNREGIATPPGVIKHVTPLGWQHVSLTGDNI